MVAYGQYIDSDEWKKRRNRYLGQHVQRCAACNKGGKLHLHHLSYENLGNEPDEDLIPLCERHHDAIHAIHREDGGVLREVTMRFVAECPKIAVKKKRKRPVSDFVPRNLRSSWVDEQGRRHVGK